MAITRAKDSGGDDTNPALTGERHRVMPPVIGTNEGKRHGNKNVTAYKPIRENFN